MQVDNEKRENLINIVQTQGVTIKKAAQMLSINYSTAKHIVKQHKLMNYGNMQSINNAALMTLQNFRDRDTTNQEIAKINQQKLFNDYVNVGISHRIASGLSGRMSGMIAENLRNLQPEAEKESRKDSRSPVEKGDDTRTFPAADTDVKNTSNKVTTSTYLEKDEEKKKP